MSASHASFGIHFLIFEDIFIDLLDLLPEFFSSIVIYSVSEILSTGTRYFFGGTRDALEQRFRAALHRRLEDALLDALLHRHAELRLDGPGVLHIFNDQ